MRVLSTCRPGGPSGRRERSCRKCEKGAVTAPFKIAGREAYAEAACPFFLASLLAFLASLWAIWKAA